MNETSTEIRTLVLGEDGVYTKGQSHDVSICCGGTVWDINQRLTTLCTTYYCKLYKQQRLQAVWNPFIACEMAHFAIRSHDAMFV